MEADDPATQYGSLLVDLKMNSKPMINVLTMMAEDHIRHAPIVVQTIERHLTSVSILKRFLLFIKRTHHNLICFVF